jgi:hypothetical protein
MRKIILLFIPILLVLFFLYRALLHRAGDGDFEAKKALDAPLNDSAAKHVNLPSGERKQIHDQRDALEAASLEQIQHLRHKKQSQGTSDFLQKINKQRAFERNIIKTIIERHGVKDARAHLSTSEVLNSEGEIPLPSASVVLKLDKNQMLSSSEITDIRFLVSGMTDRLYPENVIILDSEGRRLKENP